jgi:hypothetical protein
VLTKYSIAKKYGLQLKNWSNTIPILFQIYLLDHLLVKDNPQREGSSDAMPLQASDEKPN